MLVYIWNQNVGKAFVSLHLDLGAPTYVPGQHPPHQHSRRNGPSQQRRRNRRAAARAAQEAVSITAGVATHHASVKESDNTTAAEDAAVDLIENEEQEIAVKVVSETEEVTDEFCSNKSFNKGLESDCDIYTYGLWDTTNSCKAQDALNHIEEKIKNSFIRCNVKEEDRIFKIDGINYDISEEAFEIVVKVKQSDSYSI